MEMGMVRLNEIRTNELAITPPETVDAKLVFIGRISTPWTSRLETPRQGRHDGPVCTIEIFEPWGQALAGVERFERLEVLYWLHQSRRDLVLQSPASNGEVHGTFSIRSPVRPNPIGTSIVVLEKIEGNRLFVRGLDCLDGTPLIDLKPDRTLFQPIAPPQKGDFETGQAHMCKKVGDQS
jgi:tRNA-Thr(GGU) m(6)t(6)A37 methyltransferase TsaA